MANVTEINDVNVTLRATTGAANQTVEVLGYYAPNDGGGGQFYWRVTPTVAGDDNGGTIIVRTGVTTGRWERIYDGFIDVKWFGAKGNGTTDDRATFQNALTFISSDPTDLYISKGVYKIVPTAAADVLVLNVTAAKMINIYGDGANVSIIKYDNYATGSLTKNIFKINGSHNVLSSIRDFRIEGWDAASRSGKGLVIDALQTVTVENVQTVVLHTGIELTDFLTSSFKNVHTSWGVIGLKAQPGSLNIPPNLILFESCGFGGNTDVGVQMDGQYGLHSASFIACSFEGNGTQGVSTAGGIRAMFTGINGANGLNIIDSYFEGNKGGYDVKLFANGYGSHTFTGNTFNRISNADYTTNNILIDGNGQSPQPDFGYSKAKMVFQGNGFLATNSYVPSASRKTIELLNTATDYWQYDIVEEGNVYEGVIDAPFFNRNTPQISEYSRLKAYGGYVYQSGDAGRDGYYNVTSIVRQGVGEYRVNLANPLKTGDIPIITATCHAYASAGYCFPWIQHKTNTYFIIRTVSVSTHALQDCSFDFHVFSGHQFVG